MRVQLFTQLQGIDQQLTRLLRERHEALAQFAEHDTLRDLRETCRSLISTLKLERAHSSDLQWELDEVELRLRTLAEQEGDGPTDPLVARELVVLRERRVQLEERVLRQLERISELEQELATAEQTVKQIAAAWAEREPQLQEQIDQLGNALETLQIQRQQIAGRLDRGALELYDDLQRRHRGTALAPIRNRQCGVCRARLPGAVFDLLSGPDPLVRCPRCGRVLYIPKQESG